MKRDSLIYRRSLKSKRNNPYYETALKKKRSRYKISRRSRIAHHIRRNRRTRRSSSDAMTNSVLNSRRGLSKVRINLDERRKDWQGACIDTGAQRTAIGLLQAKAYCGFVGCKFKLKANPNQYRFGVDVQKSIGSISIRLLFLKNGFVPIEVDVVRANVPFLLGLDLLDKLQLYLDTTRDVLISSPGNISVPVVRKFRHVYLEWKREDAVLFSRSELLKLDRGFRHPTDTKLLNLIRKARSHEATEAITKVLKEISKSCNTCQRLGSQPTIFKTTLPTLQEVKFGEEISMDLMFIEGKAILHIVDTATRFSSAIFLDSQV